MSVLALDLGSDMGFALLRADGRVESGTVVLREKREEGEGQKFARFAAWLPEITAKHPDLNLVAFERVVFSGSPNAAYAIQVYGGFLALLLMFCEQRLLKIVGYNVASIKKQFAGHGRAEKADIMNQCVALGFHPQTHNEADAIAILHVATDTCPLLTMSGKSQKRRARTAPEMPEDGVPF